MRKSIVYLCAGVLMFTLAACGKDAAENPGSQDSGQESVSSGAQEEIPEESTEGGSSASDEQSGEEAGGAAQGTEGWSEEMEGLKQAAVDAVGADNYWPDMPMDAEMLEVFYGITSDLYEDYMAESPMISANVDSLVIIKAKADQADAVETALNVYRDANVSDTLQYPQNLGKIQASQVERIGDYVIFVQLGGFAVEAETEEEVLAQCQEANTQALDAIRGKLEGE